MDYRLDKPIPLLNRFGQPMGKIGVRYHRDPKFRARIVDNTRRWKAKNPDAWRKHWFGPKHEEYLAKKRARYHSMPKPTRGAYHRKRNQERKYQVLSYYSSGIPSCACCKETYLGFLSIDHINGGGGKHRKAVGQMFYNWLIRNNFPEGYQTLCMNCNLEKRLSGSCSPTKHSKGINGMVN